MSIRNLATGESMRRSSWSAVHAASGGATGDLLDATADIVAARGPANVTMAGVAELAGAPSGTLYHRFGSRSALLGELWLRTVAEFQAGFVAALAGEPVLDACGLAARHVVTWSRREPRGSRILLGGAGEYGSADWSSELRGRVAVLRAELEAALAATAQRLPGRDADALERLLLATVDLPYGVIRRHLLTGRIPASADALVETGARAILQAPSIPHGA